MADWKVHEKSGVPVSTRGEVHTRNKGVHFGSNTNGYKEINKGGKPYYVHRMVAETFIPNPEPGFYDMVDHFKPGVEHRGDNRVENLQWSNHTLNLLNTDADNVSLSGDKWRARVNVGGKPHYLGTYVDKEEAKEASAAFKDLAIKIMTFNSDGRVPT